MPPGVLVVNIVVPDAVIECRNDMIDATRDLEMTISHYKIQVAELQQSGDANASSVSCALLDVITDLERRVKQFKAITKKLAQAAT